MLTVIQRVREASVIIENTVAASIGPGLAILCGFEKEDSEKNLKRMLERCLNYRIFSDKQGKMNRSLRSIQGDLLLVPQFTLLADTSRGLRPSFTKGASPEQGKALFGELLSIARIEHPGVKHGQFGADMQVQLCNDGPVTFIMSF